MIDELQRSSDSFIDDNLILSLLARAKSKAKDTNAVRQIIAKASHYHGLSAEEVAVLVEVDDPQLLAEMFRTALAVKQAIYGKRIVLFAPLYISSYCVNNCTYCGYRCGNQEQLRRRLSPTDVKKEVEIDGIPRP